MSRFMRLFFASVYGYSMLISVILMLILFTIFTYIMGVGATIATVGVFSIAIFFNLGVNTGFLMHGIIQEIGHIPKDVRKIAKKYPGKYDKYKQDVDINYTIFVWTMTFELLIIAIMVGVIVYAIFVTPNYLATIYYFTTIGSVFIYALFVATDSGAKMVCECAIECIENIPHKLSRNIMTADNITDIRKTSAGFSQYLDTVDIPGLVGILFITVLTSILLLLGVGNDFLLGLNAGSLAIQIAATQTTLALTEGARMEANLPE